MIIGSNANFKQEVLDFKGKVLVDFWAPWCGPCQMLMPIMEEISAEFAEKVKIVKINVDEENEISSQYNVSSIPTVILFVDGQIKETIIGFHQKQDYVNLINK
jgi:thioredoxin 1